MTTEPDSVECLLSSGEELLGLNYEESHEAALTLFLQALQVAQNRGSRNDEIKALQCLGNAYLVKHQQRLAIATLEEALAIAAASPAPLALAQCHRQLAYIHKSGKNYEAALYHLEAAEATREKWGFSPLSAQAANPGQFSSLFHSIPIGLYRLLPDGSPLDINPALLKLLGFPNQDTFSHEARAHLQAMLAQIHQCELDPEGIVQNCEVQLKRYDGSPLWVRLHLRLARQADGTPLYYEGAMEDISEARAAQQALEKLATLDALTHLYNRRHFLELAQQEITRAVRFQRPLALVMADIDFFKAVNDAYGHLTGDRVLKAVAFQLRTDLRQSDILARFGGEEFIILMPETDENQAWEGAERLRRRAASHLYHEVQASISITLSLGVTSWLPSREGTVPYLDDLIQQADQALYQAKRRGRNQTQLYRG